MRDRASQQGNTQMNPKTGPHVILWSGGKDSCLALWRARRMGLEVTGGINFFDAASSRVRFHALRTEVIAEQARLVDLDLLQIGTTAANYDTVAKDALRDARRRGFRGAVFGNIHLRDVYASSAALCEDAQLSHVEPLWGEPPIRLLEEFVASGFSATITCCQLSALDES